MSAFQDACQLFVEEFHDCEWSSTNQHVLEGASYNTGEPNAYSNDSGRVYVSILCKQCGIEADYPMEGK